MLIEISTKRLILFMNMNKRWYPYIISTSNFFCL